MTGQPGDPARLRLLEFLLGAEHTVGECSGASAPQNRASAHLACLADCGYVQSHRAGRFAYNKGGRPRPHRPGDCLTHPRKSGVRPRLPGTLMACAWSAN